MNMPFNKSNIILKISLLHYELIFVILMNKLLFVKKERALSLRVIFSQQNEKATYKKVKSYKSMSRDGSRIFKHFDDLFLGRLN